MKRLLLRAGLIAAVAGLVLPAVAVAAPSTWEEGPPVPLGRIRYGHTQCPGDSGRFYVISGVDSTFNVTITTERFDVRTGKWEELPPVPVPVEAPTAVCVDNQIHLFGGGDRHAVVTTNHWVLNVGDKAWTSAAPTPRPVVGAAAGGYAGKIYLAGGDDDFSAETGTSAEVDVYDTATDRWSTAKDRMPHATAFAGSAQRGRFLYVVGGWDNGTRPVANVTATQRLDTLTGTWSTGPELPGAPADFALAATSSALYAIGGDADGGGFGDASATVRRLELTRWPAGDWTSERDPLPVSVAANSGGFATPDGRIWTVGGATPNPDDRITSKVFVKRP